MANEQAQIIPLEFYQPKRFTNAIIKPKNKDQQRLQRFIDESFIDTTPERQNILTWRSQAEGIDPFFNEVFNIKPGDALAQQLPGITSMLIRKAQQIITARAYVTYVPESGDFVRAIPQFKGASTNADAVTHAINYYLRLNKRQKRTMYDILWGAGEDGVSITRQRWNYQMGVTQVSRPASVKFNTESKTMQLVNQAEERSIILVDRPQIDYIDPLFFSIPQGYSHIGRDGGSPLTMEKILMSRSELEMLEKAGDIQGFGKLKVGEIGDEHGNEYESPEMKIYYDTLFNQKLNEGIEFEDPYYRFWVDIIMEATTPEKPITKTMMINGHIISQSAWTGGYDLPYTAHSYFPNKRSIYGYSVAFLLPDIYRQLNFTLRKEIAETQKSGNAITMIPDTSNITQNDMDKAFNQGGPLRYRRDPGDPIPPRDLFVHIPGGEVNEKLTRLREYLAQQGMEDLGIALAEVAGAEGQMPSALRSGKMFQGLASQGSRPAQMQNSLMGESLTDVYNQLKMLIFAFQDNPIEVLVNPRSNQTFTITPEDVEAFPQMLVYPNANLQQLSSDVLNTVVQMIRMLQGAVSMPDFLRFIFEFGVSPEVARRLDEVLAIPPPMQQLQPGGTAPVGNAPQQVGSPGNP